MTSSGDDGRRFPKAIWWWLAAWVVLAIVTVSWGLPNEENDLETRAGAFVPSDDLRLEFHGRDATLTGTADQMTIKETADAIYNMRGVKSVDVSGAEIAAATTTTTEPPATTSTTVAETTTTTEEVALPAPSMQAVFSDGAAELSGVMPSQEAVDAIEASAVTMYGAANVVNNMTVGEVAEPDYLTALPGVFAVTDGLNPWDLTLEDHHLTYTGLGPDQDVVTASVSAFNDYTATAAFGGADIAVEVDPNAVAASLTDLLAGGANFETGSANLSAEAEGKLDEVIEIMLANPSTILVVEGHTDNQGDAAANQALSEARAQAVVDYLVDGGVAADRLTAIGYGEEQPIADNDTAEGRATNRRIEFVVSEGA